MKRGGAALFRQTLLVLVGALVMWHLVGFLAFLLLPMGGSNTITLSGIANQLADSGCERAVSAMEHARRLELSRTSQAPAVPADMDSDALLRSQLAHVLGVPEASVQLAWAHESEIRLGRPAVIAIGDSTERLEETLFLKKLLFARKWPDYWCVGEIPQSPWFNRWQVRTLLFFLLSFAVLLPLAWLFARRLSRPMHNFATAADAIGRDEQAPLVEEQGPLEMRIAARALNAMQARIQEQLHEREAMIAAIAHDLRTPLSRIAFRVEAASTTVSESVQRDIEQMNAMITATLEYAREGRVAAEKQPIDLRDLLWQIVEDERAIGHDCRFSSNVESVIVEGNDVQLNRLFQNLLDNARHFGGTAEVGLHLEGGTIIVTVADHGPGINPDQIEDMFRPFIRGEPSRNRQTGGMGLGLSITRAIARRHGGDIQISNREGGGLLVRVSLPVAPETRA